MGEPGAAIEAVPAASSGTAVAHPARRAAAPAIATKVFIESLQEKVGAPTFPEYGFPFSMFPDRNIDQ
jgi:hypothetical protein